MVDIANFHYQEFANNKVSTDKIPAGGAVSLFYGEGLLSISGFTFLI